MYPSVTPGTSLPYNCQPWNGVAMDNTEDAEVLRSIHTREDEGYTYRNEDIQTYLDEATEMDDTRDVYEEFIDNDGPVENGASMPWTSLKKTKRRQRTIW